MQSLFEHFAFFEKQLLQLWIAVLVYFLRPNLIFLALGLKSFADFEAE